jgi:hypothetical protein
MDKLPDSINKRQEFVYERDGDIAQLIIEMAGMKGLYRL